MAGHSKFKNIMHRKGAQDKKRAKVFTKAVRDIIIAAKSGLPDPNMNASLRSAIVAAKAVNLPKDKIEGAIKKASGGADSDNYEEIRYEGYGTGGVAVVVETLTDNRNRTASEVRTAFSKNGGNLGELGSVTYMFARKGVFIYNLPEGKTLDDIMEIALEAGAEECEEHDGFIQIICEPSEFHNVFENLQNALGDPESHEICWVAETTQELDEEGIAKVEKLVEALEDCDDVQSVYTNLK